MLRVVLDNGKDWYYSHPDTQRMLMKDGRTITANEVAVGDETWIGDYFDVGAHGKVVSVENVS